jgi:S-DNA-T family DNA segregation ATPase FtsK/SpoIIIE
MGVRLFTPRTTAIDSASADVCPAPGPVRRGREAGALVLFALSAFLCLALAGLRKDPAVPALTGADWVGPVGAAVAAALAQGFGLVAWLLPVELVLVAIPMFRGRREALAIRLAGDLVIAIALAALVQVAAPGLLVFGRLHGGGQVGLLFGELMRGLFSNVGSFLVGGTLVCLILIARSSFSFIACCRATVRVAHKLVSKLAALLTALGGAWHQAWQLRRQRRDAERAASRPHIDDTPSDEAIIAKLEEGDCEWIGVQEPAPAPLAVSATLQQGPSLASGTLLKSATTPEPGFAPGQAGGQPRLRRDCHPHGLQDAEQGLPVPHQAGEQVCQQDRARPNPTSGCREAATEAACVPANAAQAAQTAGPRIVDTKAAQTVERARRGPRAKQSGKYELPSTELLRPAPPIIGDVDRDKLYQNAALLEKTLADYGVSGRVVEVHPGPTVTTFEVAPEAGTKVSRVARLTDDLALGLSRKVRIIAPIPGKSRIGFELPNDARVTVYLRELVEDRRFAKLARKAPLPVVLGRDIIGKPFYADLSSMPHILVAGATGAGKSVGLNVMLASLLLYRTPDELRLLMIDPKVVELAPYDGIPHMLLPVVTDMKQAATALRWAVDEMERRYQLFADAGTKNIVTYNKWVDRVVAGEIPAPAATQVTIFSSDGEVLSVPAAQEGSDGVRLPGRLPYVVVVVDEFSDLMMQGGKDVEACVARLAQKARAAGIHVVLATQRPSVDVITGMIKANFPSRIAYRVAQKVDSRTILDEQGAELLLGKGDMLVKTNGGEILRVQCPFIDEDEVARLTDHLRRQGAPRYHEAILAAAEDEAAGQDSEESIDPRFDEAVRIVADTQRCSTSWLQRKMTIGYNRAAKIVEMMEKRGIVGPPNGARDREVLVSPL